MKTLIILHGWQSSKEKWQKVKELLEKDGIEVIVPDLPGFKPETELGRPWNLDDYVEWLKNFSQDKENEGFFLLGHSFGGRVAIKFSVKYPFLLRGIFLVSAAGIKKEKTIFAKIMELGGEIIRFLKIEEFPVTKELWQLFRKAFYRFILRRKDYVRTSGNLKEMMKNVLEEDLTPLLEKINVPTYIIWGDNDAITPAVDAYLMNEKIKNSKMEMLVEIGHTPHLENPGLLVEKIKKHLL